MRSGPTFPNRRSIGHGNLAEKASSHLKISFLKTEVDDTPSLAMHFSNIVLASDGSTSMATVAASSLAAADIALQMDPSVKNTNKIVKELVCGLSIRIAFAAIFL